LYFVVADLYPIFYIILSTFTLYSYCTYNQTDFPWKPSTTFRE